MPRNLYPYETSWTIERDPTEPDGDGFSEDVQVEYGIEERGSPPSGLWGDPSNYDPGSATVLRLNPEAIMPDGSRLTLTEAELDKIEQWLLENPDEYDNSYDYYEGYDD